MFWEREFIMISESEKSRLQVGFKQVLKLLKENRAEKVFLAGDCEDKICEPVKSICNENGVPLEMVETMKELGQLCGIQVKASCAAVVK